MQRYESTPAEIGIRIKKIRNDLEKTMEEFAKLISEKSNRTTVSKWENGKNYPSKEKLIKIAELGNVSFKFLTTGKKDFSDLTVEEQERLLIEFDEVKNSRFQATRKGVIRFLNKFEKNESEFTLHSMNMLANTVRFAYINDPIKYWKKHTPEEKKTDPANIRFLDYIIRVLNEYYLGSEGFENPREVKKNLKDVIDLLVDNPPEKH